MVIKSWSFSFNYRTIWKPVLSARHLLNIVLNLSPNLVRGDNYYTPTPIIYIDLYMGTFILEYIIIYRAYCILCLFCYTKGTKILKLSIHRHGNTQTYFLQKTYLPLVRLEPTVLSVKMQVKLGRLPFTKMDDTSFVFLNIIRNTLIQLIEFNKQSVLA